MLELGLTHGLAQICVEGRLCVRADGLLYLPMYGSRVGCRVLELGAIQATAAHWDKAFAISACIAMPMMLFFASDAFVIELARLLINGSRGAVVF